MTIENESARLIKFPDLNNEELRLTEEGVRLIRAFLNIPEKRDRLLLAELAERLAR